MSSHPNTTAANAWVRLPAPRPAARLRLVCFHPAGAGPALFRGWPERLPADVELLAVQLPGREARFAEPRLTDYRTAVDRLHSALLPYLDRPYALFGHSMGALLAYGFAMAVRRSGDRAPERLLVSGSPGPGSAPRRLGRSTWSDEQLVAALRSMGGTPEEVLAEPGLLALVLPTLRDDFAVVESFHRPDGPLLDCPVTVLGGEQDSVSTEELHRWSAATSGDTSVRTFPGGHFFLTGPAAPDVLKTVSADLT
ncbi:thioesterase II family protein [Kitasatospora azatica]|uniref:thioesterase II family protein n=1 Tax=Kitasatospora azatica TaxID=58347 RepID=UPI00055BE2BE|nr:alpha/beta fold hydrolase [Kitasatospora azatica]